MASWKNMPIKTRQYFFLFETTFVFWAILHFNVFPLVQLKTNLSLSSGAKPLPESQMTIGQQNAFQNVCKILAKLFRPGRSHQKHTNCHVADTILTYHVYFTPHILQLRLLREVVFLERFHCMKVPANTCMLSHVFLFPGNRQLWRHKASCNESSGR